MIRLGGRIKHNRLVSRKFRSIKTTFDLENWFKRFEIVYFLNLSCSIWLFFKIPK